MEISCSGCSAIFTKIRKEHDRQVRSGRKYFFCSRRCFGKNKGKNNLNDGNRLSEHMSQMQKLAATTNTKYFGEDKAFAEILRRVRQRKKEHDLDLEFLRDLWTKQAGRCRLTNIPLVLESRDPVVRASLDRIDSKLGYVEGNVQFVSCSINWAKNSGTNEDVRRLVQLIVEASNPSGRYRRRD